MFANANANFVLLILRTVSRRTSVGRSHHWFVPRIWGAASRIRQLSEATCWSPRPQVGQAIFNHHGLGANSQPFPCSRPPATRVQKAPDRPVDAGWCWSRHRPLRTEFRPFYVEFLEFSNVLYLNKIIFYLSWWHLYFFTST